MRASKAYIFNFVLAFLFIIFAGFIDSKVYAEESAFSYTLLQDGTICITDWNGVDNDVVVPSSIDGKAVSVLGDYAFQKKSIKSIILPDSIMQIGKGTFAECYDLRSVILSNNIEVIPEDTFFEDAALESVILPKQLKRICTSAFCNCPHLTTIDLPEGIKNIEADAFFSCSITSLYIPASLEKIENGAFRCFYSLSEILVSNNNDNYIVEDNILFTKDKKTLLLYPAGSTATEYLVPTGVEIIGNAAFEASRNLVKIVLPEGLKIIESNAFLSCDHIDDFTMPDSVVALGDFAFGGGVNSIHLSANLKSIGRWAFQGCQFTTIVLPDSLDSIGSFAFTNCRVRTISIPENMTKIDSMVFYECADLISAFIPDSIRALSTSSFYNCHKVTLYVNSGSYAEMFCREHGFRYTINAVMELPKGLLSIEENAFESIRANIIYLPDGLKSIGNGAFSDNKYLFELVIPESVNSIGENAFKGCFNLIAIVKDGSYAHEWCKDTGQNYKCR